MTSTKITVSRTVSVNLHDHQVVKLADNWTLGMVHLEVGWSGDQREEARLGTVNLTREELTAVRDAINTFLGMKNGYDT